MSEQEQGTDRNTKIVGIVSAVVLAGAAVWLMTTPPEDEPQGGVFPPAPSAEGSPGAATGVYGDGPGSAEEANPMLAMGGRMKLDAADLTARDEPVSLVLELPDDLRGQTARPVRIVSTDLRRLDLTAQPRSGRDAGVSLDVEPAFLTPGRYMIEIETDDRHPLQIKRYVLEVE